MKLYLFDVDETLAVSPLAGLVTIETCRDLRAEGHILGLCGSFTVVTGSSPNNGSPKNWHDIFSLLNIGVPDKVLFMNAVKQLVPAEEHVFVGNGPGGRSPDDSAACAQTGWRFIKESDFAAGAR